MNSIILKELLTNASRHKGEPLPAAIKIIVNYVKEMEDKDFHHTSDRCKTALKDEKAWSKWLRESNDELSKVIVEMNKDAVKSAKYIGELEARIDELEEESDKDVEIAEWNSYIIYSSGSVVLKNNTVYIWNPDQLRYKGVCCNQDPEEPNSIYWLRIAR
jgi:hypothetical protein